MPRVPLWLKLVYTAWMAVWVPLYWIHAGPSNFLWLCDVANFVVLAALWLESPLLASSQAVGVLLVQLVWMVDVFTRLILGFHPVGGTEYMFDSTVSLGLRSLSLFHVAMPVLLLWLVRRLGYDRRGWILETGIATLLLPASFLAGTVEQNLNWLWAPFGIPQTLMPPAAFVLVAIVAYPLVLFLPTHGLLSWWSRRSSAVRMRR